MLATQSSWGKERPREKGTRILTQTSTAAHKPPREDRPTVGAAVTQVLRQPSLSSQRRSSISAHRKNRGRQSVAVAGRTHLTVSCRRRHAARNVPRGEGRPREAALGHEGSHRTSDGGNADATIAIFCQAQPGARPSSIVVSSGIAPPPTLSVAYPPAPTHTCCNTSQNRATKVSTRKLNQSNDALVNNDRTTTVKKQIRKHVAMVCMPLLLYTQQNG